MIYRTIELAKYPTIGEVVFPDEPNVVYWNKYALPSCKNDRYYPLMPIEGNANAASARTAATPRPKLTLYRKGQAVKASDAGNSAVCDHIGHFAG